MSTKKTTTKTATKKTEKKTVKKPTPKKEGESLSDAEKVADVLQNKIQPS